MAHVIISRRSRTLQRPSKRCSRSICNWNPGTLRMPTAAPSWAVSREPGVRQGRRWVVGLMSTVSYAQPTPSPSPVDPVGALRRDGDRSTGAEFEMSGRGDYFFTSEFGVGRASRQGLRPDLRRGARRLPDRGPRGARRLRDLRHHRPGGRRRRGARPRRGARADRGDRPPLRAGHRLRAEGLPLGQPARAQLHPRPVRAHRPGRRRRRRQGGGRGRPGHHVRLRHRRDPRADAGADPLLARHPPPPRRGAQERRRGPPRPRRQGAALAALRRRQAGRGLLPRALDPASRRDHGVGRRARDGRALHPRGACPRAG